MEILAFYWYAWSGYSLPTLVYTAFWVWMLIECVQNDPQRDVWMWILIFIPCPGAVVYFFVRRSHLHFSLPAFGGRVTRRRELRLAEAEARNIGNAYYFVQWGDLLLETRQYPKAAEAYERALSQEPRNEEALWGAAQAEVLLKRLRKAKEHLETLLAVDPKFKFGEPSIAYGRTLVGLGELDAARKHMEKHVQSWPHAQGKILLASVLARTGDGDRARSLCGDALEEIRFSPDFNRQRSRALRREAGKVLRNL